jgi:hypothetical protein
MSIYTQQENKDNCTQAQPVSKDVEEISYETHKQSTQELHLIQSASQTQQRLLLMKDADNTYIL